MGRLISWLLWSCVLGTSAFAQTSARAVTDAESAQMDAAINRVRNLPAHQLDRRLPKVILAEWLQAQAARSSTLQAMLHWASAHLGGTSVPLSQASMLRELLPGPAVT